MWLVPEGQGALPARVEVRLSALVASQVAVGLGPEQAAAGAARQPLFPLPCLSLILALLSPVYAVRFVRVVAQPFRRAQAVAAALVDLVLLVERVEQPI